jgi:hypothetical protein
MATKLTMRSEEKWDVGSGARQKEKNVKKFFGCCLSASYTDYCMEAAKGFCK